MDNSDIYVGLDIGTTSIKVIVAEWVQGQMNVIGVGRERSDGINRGVIVDIDKAAIAIRNAVKVAERKANIEISSVVAGIPANMLNIESCRGMIAIADSSREIGDQDVANVSNAASLHNLPAEREVVDVLPEEFIVDGFDGIKDPRGMVGVRLEMKGSLLIAPKTIIHNLERAVNQAGLELLDVIVNPLALATTVLNDGEQDFGTIILDLGAGQTTASVIHDHKLKYTYVEQVGGQYVTKDISVVLNTSIESAERLKVQFGYALADEATDDKFPVPVVGQDEPVEVTEKYLSEIIEARLEQTLTDVKEQLDAVGALDMPGGIVLTGGNAALPGITDLVEDIFGVNAKIFVPESMGLRHPEFAQVLALLNYEVHLNEVSKLVKNAMVTTNANVISNDNYVSQQSQQIDPQPTKSIRNSVQPSMPQSSTTKSEPKQSSTSSLMDRARKWFSEFFD